MRDERTDALGMPTADMRRLGYWVVDRVVEHYERGPDGPAIRGGDAAELRGRLGGPVPQDPGDPMDALQELVDVALFHMQHGDHPRYFARVPGPSSFAGVLGDWLGTGFNALAASWGGGAGPAMVELVVLDWIRELLGMPVGTEGVILSGGSLSNLTGLAAARHARGPGLAYLSDQTHASVRRGLEAIGFAPDDIRTLPTDDGFVLRAEVLADAVRGDRAHGGRPQFVVATAGTTNTGAVDELDGIADVCAAEELWLHVDGAYGAPAALCPAGRGLLGGLERADSVTLDPHKWLFAPYDCAALLYRDPSLAKAVHTQDAAYLSVFRTTPRPPGQPPAGGRGGGEEPWNPTDYAFQLSRRSRGMPLWFSLAVHGIDAYRDAVEAAIATAREAAELVAATSYTELVREPELSIVLFRRRGWTRADYDVWSARLLADQIALCVPTTWEGEPTARLALLHPETTLAIVQEVLDSMA